MEQEVLIYERNTLFALGLEKLLSKYYRVKIIEGIKPSVPVKTDTFVLIISLDSVSLEQIEEVSTYSQAKIIVLCESCDKEALIKLLNARVQAVLLKASNPSQIVESINNILEDKTYVDFHLSPLLSDLLLNGVIYQGEESSYNLTERQKQIIDLIEQGFSNQEIANLLFISVATVKYHLSHIYRKYNVKCRQGLVSKLSN